MFLQLFSYIKSGRWVNMYIVYLSERGRMVRTFGRKRMTYISFQEQNVA